jgi:hypothetical protein
MRRLFYLILGAGATYLVMSRVARVKAALAPVTPTGLGETLADIADDARTYAAEREAELRRQLGPAWEGL